MKGEIEIYYRYRKLDKEHQYMIVCQQSATEYCNHWIFWIWYKMGVAFGKNRKFSILPYKITWDDSVKLIKVYKSCNTGTDRVAPAILAHFKKLKKKP